MKKEFVIPNVVASIVLGIFLAWAPTYEGLMAAERGGVFTGIGSHNAAGNVAVTKDRNGQSVLVMTNIDVDRVPDGRVYLANGQDYRNGVELGKLKTFTGIVSFRIPAAVDVGKYDTILVWCKKFDVGIGKAPLR